MAVKKAEIIKTLKPIEEKLKEIFEKIKIEQELCEACRISLLPVKSVGVQGDNRTYAHPCAVKIPRNKIQDPDKSQISKPNFQIDWQKVERFSPQITNAMKKEVNRVLLEVSMKNLEISQGSLIQASLTKERLDLLREIDAIVQTEVFNARLEKAIWQFPAVLIPFGIDGKESVVLRPVSSLEAMTARFYPLEEKVLSAMVNKIEALNKISFIFYDVTNKPPATIEWE